VVARAIAGRNSDEGIRPFNMQRDLLQLADLIELTFRTELDQPGNQIAAELRRLARAGPLLWLLGAFSTAISPLMCGYVWIANSQLVGNVTLNLESGLQSITNVAVHPDFRERGIARQLMEVALREARNKGAQLVMLQVRTDNVAAQQLYHSLGFQVYDTIAKLSLPAHKRTKWTMLPSLALRKRRPDDWQGLYKLFTAATPAKAQEVKPIPSYHYRLGIERRLERWITDFLFRRRNSDWVLEENGKIVALLQTTGQYTRAAHCLQITVHPHSRGTIEKELLAVGLYRLNRFPTREVVSTVSTSHPEAQQALHQAGFHTVRLLDQMLLDLRNTSQGGL